MQETHTRIEGLRVLVVEDEPLIAEAVGDQLIRAGCEVVARVDNGVDAIAATKALQPDVILMDVQIKGEMDGLQTAEVILQELQVPIVYLTAHSETATLERARARSAFGYVLKPFRIDSLLVAMAVAVDRFRAQRQLEESRLSYEMILSSGSDGAIVTDVDGRVQFMNSVAARLTGWSTGEAQGRPASAILTIAQTGIDRCDDHPVERALRGRQTATLGCEAVILSRDGTQVMVEGGASPVLDHAGRLVGATIAIRDVTEIRQAQTDTTMMAMELRAVVDTAVDGVMLIDADGTIKLFNPACELLFGYLAPHLIGCAIETLLPSALTDILGPPVAGERTSGQTQVRVKARATSARRRDGTTFPAELSIGETSSDRRSGFVIVVHDVSERQQLQAALIEGAAREQRRLGRDLHDGLGQELAGLTLLTEALVRSAVAAGLANVADLERISGVARHAAKSCRNIAYGLSPIDETQGGLVRGLRDLVRRLKETPGPDIEFAAIEEAQLGVSPETAEHLYRIAQEALANSLRHAHAQSIRVTLDIEPDNVRLEVCDDGEGLNMPHAITKGLGMRTMRYRAAIIGARFAVAVKEPAGTCIVCECPQAA